MKDVPLPLEALGFPRVIFATCYVMTGAFLTLALMNSVRFGWGFKYLDAAIVYGMTLPVVLLVETVLIAIRLLSKRWQDVFAKKPEVRGAMVLYLLVGWALAAFYIVVLI